MNNITADQIADAALALRRNHLALARALKERGESLSWQEVVAMQNRDTELAERLWRLVDRWGAQQPASEGEQGALL